MSLQKLVSVRRYLLITAFFVMICATKYVFTSLTVPLVMYDMAVVFGLIAMFTLAGILGIALAGKIDELLTEGLASFWGITTVIAVILIDIHPGLPIFVKIILSLYGLIGLFIVGFILWEEITLWIESQPWWTDKIPHMIIKNWAIMCLFAVPVWLVSMVFITGTFTVEFLLLGFMALALLPTALLLGTSHSLLRRAQYLWQWSAAQEQFGSRASVYVAAAIFAVLIITSSVIQFRQIVWVVLSLSLTSGMIVYWQDEIDFWLRDRRHRAAIKRGVIVTVVVIIMSLLLNWLWAGLEISFWWLAGVSTLAGITDAVIDKSNRLITWLELAGRSILRTAVSVPMFILLEVMVWFIFTLVFNLTFGTLSLHDAVENYWWDVPDYWKIVNIIFITMLVFAFQFMNDGWYFVKRFYFWLMVVISYLFGLAVTIAGMVFTVKLIADLIQAFGYYPDYHPLGEAAVLFVCIIVLAWGAITALQWLHDHGWLPPFRDSAIYAIMLIAITTLMYSLDHYLVSLVVTHRQLPFWYIPGSALIITSLFFFSTKRAELKQLQAE